MLRLLSRYNYTPSIKFRSQLQNQSQIKFSGKKVKMTNRQALNAAMDQQLERDQNVFIIGEQVAQYNGAYKITKGLWAKYGDTRVVDTPISEPGFTGIAVGASFMGLKPIVEFMTMNFALQSIDQIVNSCVKLRYMSGGLCQSPVVFRGLNGPAAAVAAQHSQCFASYYSNIPGLITVTPYDAEDCKGLLKQAVRGKDPVMFLQNQNLYSQTFEVPEQVLDKDFRIPIGKAKIMKQGTDVTIVAYSRNVKFSLEAAQKLSAEGISCEVINLRTIKPMDRDCIIESVKKTGRLITVEDGFPQSGIGAQIISVVTETVGFDFLRGPAQRVTAADVPMPYAQILENRVTPKADTIIKAINKAMKF